MALILNRIHIKVEPGILTTPEAITPNRYSPKQTEYGLLVAVKNTSEFDLEWLNVRIGRHQNHRVYTKSKSDNPGGTKHTFGWQPGGEARILKIPAGATVTAFHRPPTYANSENDGVGPWLPLMIYGARPGYVPFVHWLREPITYGVEINYTPNSCFVASAAYQDSNHPMVRELRFVRDELLKPTVYGRKAIDVYYRHGPKIANIVGPHPSLRLATRAVLTPIALSIRSIKRLRALAFKRSCE